MDLLLNKGVKHTEAELAEIKEHIALNQSSARLLELFKYETRRKLDPVEKRILSQQLANMLRAKNLSGLQLHEMIDSKKAQYLLPSVVIGAVMEAMDPMMLFSPLFDVIEYNGGGTVEFPVLGELRAFQVAEGAEYPEQDFEMTQYRNLTIKVGKYGLMLRITEEAIQDCQWDIMGYWLKAAGRAMIRLKEEQCAIAMTMSGHTVFDALSSDPQLQPTGVNSSGQTNSTMSIMDFIDMLSAVMYNDHKVTDIIMHPLAWNTFLKNEITGAYGKGMLSYFDVWAKPPGTVSMDSPQSIIQRNMPLGVNVILSPMAPINKASKTFDMIAIDRNNLGVIIQKEALSTESFGDQNRDISCVKIKEKYGIGIVDEGRGIAVCKNIALAPSYNKPLLVSNI
jgi:hypothetical protein